MGRIKGKIGDLLVPGNLGSWDDVRGRLNRLLRGWSGYFSHGALSATSKVMSTTGYATSSDGGTRRRRRRTPAMQPWALHETSRRAGCGKPARPVR